MHNAHDAGALVDLARVDLNLLVVLDALLKERHVTRAAARLGLSQSAASHALSRLRAHFDDPLLVRDRSLLVPTERALGIAEPLAQALGSLAAALTQPVAFDPLTTRRTFVIGAADYGQFVLLPPLLERLREAAPGLDLDVRDVVTPPTEALAPGGTDLLVGPPLDPRRAGSARPSKGRKAAPGAPSGTSIRSRRLFDERFVCVVRKDHPRVKRKLDLETFAELPHAFVAPRGTRGGVVDDVLAGLGRERRVAVMGSISSPPRPAASTPTSARRPHATSSRAWPAHAA